MSAGADIVAIDATDRPRPDGKTVADTLEPLKAEGVLTMADCMTIDDIRRAVDLGFDIVSTTLSHGVAAIDCTMADGPDLPLLRQAAEEFPGFPRGVRGSRAHARRGARRYRRRRLGCGRGYRYHASHEPHELVQSGSRALKPLTHFSPGEKCVILANWGQVAFGRHVSAKSDLPPIGELQRRVYW